MTGRQAAAAAAAGGRSRAGAVAGPLKVVARTTNDPQLAQDGDSLPRQPYPFDTMSSNARLDVETQDERQDRLGASHSCVGGGLRSGR